METRFFKVIKKRYIALALLLPVGLMLFLSTTTKKVVELVNQQKGGKEIQGPNTGTPATILGNNKGAVSNESIEVNLGATINAGDTITARQELYRNFSAPTSATVQPYNVMPEIVTALDDPGLKGPCVEIRAWEYGGSNDPIGSTTDISSYFNSPSSSVSIRMNAVPLHGIVRYPSGPGPFPLVIIVHGNHDPTDPSYPGYIYLLEHLASHCMIVVSVEEDFLNGNVSGEIDARAIVLLRHLQLWREWNSTPGHLFIDKVDMNNIGLVGHSRGGEAIVGAQYFNTTKHRASDPAVGATSHNFNFGIKALYAIAPVDGRFDTNGVKLNLTLSGADYYIMQGTHDGDVSGFPGQKTYNRAFPVQLPTKNYKGLLWIYGANHGQWNTRWGTCCEFTVPPSTLLISANDQMQIAKTYMGAFFIASLKGGAAYRNFLNGEVTFASLPSTVTRIFQYQDPQRLFINHFEEDTDVTTTSIALGKNTKVGTFATYKNYNFSDRKSPHFLWGQTRGLIAGWKNNNQPELQIKMPQPQTGSPQIPDYKFLAFHTGQTHESSPNLNQPGTTQDFSVRLDFNGTLGPEVKVSSYQSLLYPLITASTGNMATKSIQQTVRIPFSDLKGTTGFRVRDISVIRLIFNKNPKGNIAIDEIQFTN